MPNIRSASKRMRQNQTRYRENLSVKRSMRQAIKQTYDAISNHQEQEAREHAKNAQKAIDKAVKKGVIKKNTGARKKSRLTRQLEQAFASSKSGSDAKKTSGGSQKQASGNKKSGTTSGSKSKSTSSSSTKKQSGSSK